MEFQFNKSLEILERTPAVIKTLLSGLSDDWTNNNEGGDSWNPVDIVGHLIHCEETDFPPRVKKILTDTGDKKFEPFDRSVKFERGKGKSLGWLLDEFTNVRRESIVFLRSLNIDKNILSTTGIHPVFGEVTLRQLLATWTAHDLGHIAQISRVMARQYKVAVGPWIEYLPVLTR